MHPFERMLVVTRGIPRRASRASPERVDALRTPRRANLSADFLRKPTTPFAYVVPADTPVRSAGVRVTPGTGV